VRTQLRSYLEALLTDVETEWGKADPTALPIARPPAQRSAGRTSFEANTVEEPADDEADAVPAGSGERRSG